MFKESVIAEFEVQARRLRERSRSRREAVALKAVVNDDEDREALSVEESLGRPQPGDQFQGDTNLRTLHTLLKMVDERGFERSPHQMRFHEAFERSCARVIYRDDWATQKPVIMKKRGWSTSSSEVMIRRARAASRAPRALRLTPKHGNVLAVPRVASEKHSPSPSTPRAWR